MYVCYNTLLIFSSAFWAGTFARVVVLFYWKGLSTKQEVCFFFFSPTDYTPEAIFKWLDAVPKNSFKILLLKGRILPFTFPSSHSGWHLQQTLICPLKSKLASQELYSQAVETTLSNREKNWLDKR